MLLLSWTYSFHYNVNNDLWIGCFFEVELFDLDCLHLKELFLSFTVGYKNNITRKIILKKCKKSKYLSQNWCEWKMDPPNALWHHSHCFILNPMCSSSAPKEWKKTTRPKACAEHWTVNAFVQLAVKMTWKWSVVCLSFQKLLFLQSCYNTAHCCTWS